MTSAAHQQARLGQQLSLDELGEPLHAITFVVVDLETTGGAANGDAITEIGAVKVRGGEVLGEFQTLVNPLMAITPFVSVLTGITDSMVGTAPTISAAVPAFLEFARGSVLVAHNAPFDIGFLKAACAQLSLPWPAFAVVDTAVLARRVLTRDEVPNCKLATLAPFFRAATTPTHRALDDARATVDVLHGLIARLGSVGVHSLTELREFTAQVTDAQRRKRHLADGLPPRPGVYIFRDAQGRPLYVGTSRNLRSRVRQYFVASETRSRMGEMVGLAERVDPIECAHTLEAQVRELRLIAAHKPRYNKRSKFPERSVWLKLTVEPYPRLSIVRDRRDDGASYLGPLRTQRQAEAVRDAIHDAVPLRQCSDRLSLRRVVRAACVLAGIGRCGAPCEGNMSPQQYAALVGLVASAWVGDVRPLVEPLERKIAALAETQRYEQAGVLRDRISTVVQACARMQRLASLRAVAELVGARPDGDGGWEISIVRAGRLAAAGHAPRGVPPWPVIEALRQTADVVDPSHEPLAEETECILRWLEEPGTRLADASGGWMMPAFGAGRMSSYLAGGARQAADPFADRRRLPVVSRPTRASA
ncbi:MAG TPA: DEDD exonuclease domain-containing protein [Jatrophihabitans sp.]|uniref:DEDD exonuclease domain-containing protein n=1 Tax=Jatrophihabitans sp. TaxID=1932789 RepID=UPI002E0011BC|nr:DEDD exonuclease domain-containing protein [Jatrophihabitans sp.]